MKYLVLAVTTLSLLSGGLVVAAEDEASEPGYEQKFTWYDKDKNGVLSQQEAAARTDFSEKWSELDANGDGQVDLTEFSAFEEANKSDPNAE